MKKVTSFLLAALMAASTLTACGGKDDLLTHKYDYDLSEYITLGEYKGLPAEGYRFSISDEEIQQQILSTRAYYSRSTIITDRGADWGDIVYIDYVTTVDGEEIEGGSEVDCELTLGYGTFLDEFESALIGAQAGDTFSVDATFPEPYATYPELSGKAAHFEIAVKEVRAQELPEYTDDFVRAYLGYESIADFEAQLVVKMEEHYKEIYYQYVIDQTWDVVLEATEVKKYPEAEVNEICEDMIASNEAYAKAQGINFTSYVEAVFGMTEEEFRTYVREEAEARVKTEMICYAIAREENITLTEEEYIERATVYAKEYYELASLEAFEAIYDKGTIRQTLMIDKVKEAIADYAAVTYLNDAE